jgi:hypothetical protein
MPKQHPDGTPGKKLPAAPASVAVQPIEGTYLAADICRAMVKKPEPPKSLT